MENAVRWRDNVAHAETGKKALERGKSHPGELVWLDLEGDVAQYSETFTNTYHLSSMTTETILDERERAKLVAGRGYFYMVAHGLVFDAEQQTADTPKLDIVFAPEFVLTIHRAPMPWLDTLRQGVVNGKMEENVLARGMPYLVHAILDALVDSYFPVLDAIDDVVDDLENATVTNTSNAVQARIFRMKRALVQMRRVISPQVEVANGLITRTGEMIPREAELYFADVHDHLVRAFEVLDSYRDLMSGLLDVYLTTVSNRLNEVMKQLTIIATIFLPITFVTGVFGQNFGHSPQVDHDAGWNFWIVLAALAAISAMQLWYFKRRGWIGRS